MSELPMVCCVMLTKDRPEMAARAVRCFREQTYQQKILIIWDSGEKPLDIAFTEDYQVSIWQRTTKLKNIGDLRNEAAKWICNGPTPIPEILIHWDDDDYSAPDRIASQVEQLQASKQPIVGYREMLFYKEPREVYIGKFDVTGEAWLYTNNDPRYCLGTSLCYWARTWQAAPFPVLRANHGTGEDKEFCRIHGSEGFKMGDKPLMIASQHGSNTATLIIPASENWKRVPEWDAHCRERMAL